MHELITAPQQRAMLEDLTALIEKQDIPLGEEEQRQMSTLVTLAALLMNRRHAVLLWLPYEEQGKAISWPAKADTQPGVHRARCLSTLKLLLTDV